MTQFDLIVFDCDGVLVDSELLARQALLSVFRDGGIEIDADLARAAVGMKFADVLALIETRTGLMLDPARHGNLWPETEKLFARHLRAMPGIFPFLDRVAAVPRCVASSSQHLRIRRSLELTGLAERFAPDAIFSSQDVSRGKPAPDLFLLAAARMGADPRRCLVIEDTRFGILGAKAAGMAAFGFLGGAHLRGDAGEALVEAGADFLAGDWAAVAHRLGLGGS
ncbi:HAD family hydrolase [Aureimonas psammosilenae]|uniref:HAD family hydrolase n=1 Tax=Aureimonas psammosilenae TaxID=2495496 RepID=UPI001260B0A3|nr:HAD family phosphatase [Aureimonas psammosilenae]